MPLHFNWYLHPQFLMKMIYLFAASGQRSYAKYSRLYLHETLILSDTNRRLNKQLEDGYHTARHSSRFWAGLSSDLIIEQILMRWIKCTGGLTRGRNFDKMLGISGFWVSVTTLLFMNLWSNFQVLVLVQEFKILIRGWKGAIATMINVNNFSTGSKLKIYMVDGNPYSISTGFS